MPSDSPGPVHQDLALAPRSIRYRTPNSCIWLELYVVAFKLPRTMSFLINSNPVTVATLWFVQNERHGLVRPSSLMEVVFRFTDDNLFDNGFVGQQFAAVVLFRKVADENVTPIHDGHDGAAKEPSR